MRNKILRERGWRVYIAIVLLVSVPAVCRAELIEIGIAGVVDSVDDPYNLLENGVQEGASISGFYAYDSYAPDLSPQASYGSYQFSSSPFGISLTAGSFTFETDPANVDLLITIADDYDGYDRYRVISYNNLPLSSEISLGFIDWQVHDYTATALSSDALPLMPLDLSQWQSNSLYIWGMTNKPESETFHMEVQIDSVWAIPEPATLLLFGIGGLLLRKRR